MQPIKLFILFLTICLCSFAETSSSNDCVPYGTQIILNKKYDRVPNKRPKSPSLQIISCTYDTECLTLEFTVSEGMVEVNIIELNSGIITSYSVDSSELRATFYIGIIKESSIEVTTEEGNTYIGTISNQNQ